MRGLYSPQHELILVLEYNQGFRDLICILPYINKGLRHGRRTCADRAFRACVLGIQGWRSFNGSGELVCVYVYAHPAEREIMSTSC
jgi:hypothetical protein